MDTILSARNSDGGFGGRSGYPSDILDTALALQGLMSMQSVDNTTISSAVNYLISCQNSDGGWGFVSGQSSRTYYTVVVLQALELQSPTTTLATAINKATAYIISQQQLSGSFGSVYETVLAYIALIDATTDATILGNAINYLTSTQSTDGSWNQDQYTTALCSCFMIIEINRTNC